jgi:hypothetical protein
MAETPNGERDERVRVGFIVELAILPPEESTDFDAVSYGGEQLLDALSGWGIGVARIAHVEDPDRIFTA